ncbi:hypothetical protein ADIS_2058 [Lunatimonas lonarensis]|uniref:Uncharacterized protein n=1 Tax=Lunatimonas lonarensis TaxID=1232681 RepID=R7ZTZ9_9BACT|nr:hypothetical protein ADIS_2058 [Lunatimonas lonarensis]
MAYWVLVAGWRLAKVTVFTTKLHGMREASKRVITRFMRQENDELNKPVFPEILQRPISF